MLVAGAQIALGALALALLVLLAIACWQSSAAEGRARRLLETTLTPLERERLDSTGYLEVPSPQTPERFYRIPLAIGRVRMYEGGRFVCELCLMPTRRLPQSDIVLMHKLLITDDEAAYLAVANHFPPGASRNRWSL